MAMISVGIRELKAKLSAYMDRVRSGSEVMITEHGQETALIVPLSKERRAIQNLTESGKVQWSGKGKPSGIKGVRLKGKPLSETVLEERG